MKFLYKYPQARISLSAADRGEPRRQRRRARVRAARHRRLRRRPLLRHRHRVRQGRPGRHRASASRRSTAGPSRRRCTSCRTSGSATPGRWGGTPEPRADDPASRPRGRDGFVAWSTDDAARRDAQHYPGRLSPRPALPVRPRRRRAAVHRQRNQHAARLRAGRRQPQALRQGRLPPPRRRRRAVPQSREAGTKAALHYRFDAVPPGGSVVLRLRLSDRGRARRAARRGRRDRRPAPGRGRRVLRGDPPAEGRPPTSAASSARRSPACSGPSRATSSTWTSGSTATTPTAAARRRARRSATSTGGISIRCA